MSGDGKSLASGGFFIAVGLLYGSIAFQSLPIGEVLNMGPGFFPIVLSGLLVLFGAIIVVRSFFEAQETPFGIVPWRAILMLSLAIVIFASFIRQLGMLPGVFATAFIA